MKSEKTYAISFKFLKYEEIKQKNELKRKILVIVILLAGFSVSGGYVFAQSNHEPIFIISFGVLQNIAGKFIQFVSNSEGQEQVLTVPVDDLIFETLPKYNENGRMIALSLAKDPKFNDLYRKIGFHSKSQTTAFVYPIFTQAAYSKNGFYDYYHKRCDSSCLTVSIPSDFKGSYSSSIVGSFVLSTLNYSFITDVDIDKNPDILKQYKRIIILHNEYVTKKEFDAITNHPDTVYFYPNALYAEVKSDYTSNTITLVRGHGYPEPNLRNGFNWTPDNSKYEYDVSCDNWTFYLKADKTMLNCYPEYKMVYSPAMLLLLQNPDPTVLLDDTANWLRYQGNLHYAHVLLADYDINGTYIPPWVSNPAQWVITNQIHKSEFLELIDYLYKNNIVR